MSYVEQQREGVLAAVRQEKQASFARIVEIITGAPQKTDSAVYRQITHTVKTICKETNSPLRRVRHGVYEPSEPAAAAESTAPTAPPAPTGKETPAAEPPRRKRSPKENGWRGATIRVLQEAGEPMRVSDIAAAILDRGYYTTNSPSPTSCVAATLAASKSKEGEDSPFIYVSPGVWGLRELLGKQSTQVQKRAGIITSYGLNWQVSNVDWDSPQLLGRESPKAGTVDFSKQKGVYALYRGDRVIYVGRAFSSPIAARLRSHMSDRLTSLWDSWSWFGILSVDENGTLRDRSDQFTIEEVVVALEAISIELAEPVKNRRAGDGLDGLAYLQVTDPEVIKNQVFHHMHKAFKPYSPTSHR